MYIPIYSKETHSERERKKQMWARGQILVNKRCCHVGITKNHKWQFFAYFVIFWKIFLLLFWSQEKTEIMDHHILLWCWTRFLKEKLLKGPSLSFFSKSSSSCVHVSYEGFFSLEAAAISTEVGRVWYEKLQSPWPWTRLPRFTS